MDAHWDLKEAQGTVVAAYCRSAACGHPKLEEQSLDKVLQLSEHPVILDLGQLHHASMVLQRTLERFTNAAHQCGRTWRACSATNGVRHELLGDVWRTCQDYVVIDMKTAAAQLA